MSTEQARQGSSPLTRGAPFLDLSNNAQLRLIPAHAGSTVRITERLEGATAHPRSRGEHDSTACLVHPFGGSSPLTRGARRTGCNGPPRTGLIPAHAGSTWITAFMLAGSWAHPRSRGEHSSSTIPNPGIRGSSPLTRGALPCGPPSKMRLGLIPAHAGSTEHPAHVARVF